jgi:hypothetical protein
MANPDHRQVANLPLCDEALDVFVMLGIPIEQIDRDETVPDFNLAY